MWRRLKPTTFHYRCKQHKSSVLDSESWDKVRIQRIRVCHLFQYHQKHIWSFRPNLAGKEIAVGLGVRYCAALWKPFLEFVFNLRNFFCFRKEKLDSFYIFITIDKGIRSIQNFVVPRLAQTFIYKLSLGCTADAVTGGFSMPRYKKCQACRQTKSLWRYERLRRFI